MTFETWQTTKRLVSVEDKALQGYSFDDDTEQCWLYAGGLVIECRSGGHYLLQLPRDQELSQDIEPLERRLYEFGVGEGSIP